jgi:hypothetical protein
METLGQHRLRRGRSRRSIQVQHQQIDCSILQKHPRHRQRLLERARRKDDQPFELDAP